MRFLKRIYSDSLLKNSIYLMATNLSNLILGFFFWVIATRYYTPDEVGTVSAVLSSMLLIAMVSSLGFPIALLFYLPRDPANARRIINSCMIASIAASLVFSLIFISGLEIWTPSLKPVLGDLEPAILFAAVTVVSTVSALISGAFTAGKRSFFHMAKETLFGFVKIFPLVLFAGFGAMGIFLSWGIGLVLAVIMGFILLYKVWKGYFLMLEFDPVIKSMVSFSAGNYIAGIFSSLPRFVLPIIIMNMISAESTGFFFIAMTVASLLHGVPLSISNSLLAESSDGEKFWGNVGKAVRFNVALLLPGLLLFVLLGKFFLNLFNPDYAENASTTLIILAAASIPLSLSSIFTAVRNTQKRVASVVKINAVKAAITLVLSVPLIKSSGIEGAAAAYLAANTIAAIAVIYKMKNPVEFALKLVLSKAGKHIDR
ncbi:membrane protein involved in the export of O-antigen and teichoic acid [Candidatus Methanoperedens nitroreducens]|uniref:Membrane protein involved in the export of O-antigen and teichoic acid n=1 Tax=Candidatus Methanoperedens nitratireducens TaxID=1392998 RepID=A0A062V8M6_9EURY|nr:oligosaccharide flippase family protein [Candidatus Methanoperedens nitroreducens]KCZ71725.1 membrane protein involved in the export of O-antigen and teichoic acid [Candidatus Methanoperedens nitroreducens]MDJ1422302.1 oligosaccharide flippase family protein [Candidatus Methanoperedens sp.]